MLLKFQQKHACVVVSDSTVLRSSFFTYLLSCIPSRTTVITIIGDIAGKSHWAVYSRAFKYLWWIRDQNGWCSSIKICGEMINGGVENVFLLFHMLRMNAWVRCVLTVSRILIYTILCAFWRVSKMKNKDIDVAIQTLANELSNQKITLGRYFTNVCS